MAIAGRTISASDAILACFVSSNGASLTGQMLGIYERGSSYFYVAQESNKVAVFESLDRGKTWPAPSSAKKFTIPGFAVTNSDLVLGVSASDGFLWLTYCQAGSNIATDTFPPADPDAGTRYKTFGVARFSFTARTWAVFVAPGTLGVVDSSGAGRDPGCYDSINGGLVAYGTFADDPRKVVIVRGRVGISALSDSDAIVTFPGHPDQFANSVGLAQNCQNTYWSQRISDGALVEVSASGGDASHFGQVCFDGSVSIGGDTYVFYSIPVMTLGSAGPDSEVQGGWRKWAIVFGPNAGAGGNFPGGEYLYNNGFGVVTQVDPSNGLPYAPPFCDPCNYGGGPFAVSLGGKQIVGFPIRLGPGEAQAAVELLIDRAYSRESIVTPLAATVGGNTQSNGQSSLRMAMAVKAGLLYTLWCGEYGPPPGPGFWLSARVLPGAWSAPALYFNFNLGGTAAVVPMVNVNDDYADFGVAVSTLSQTLKGLTYFRQFANNQDCPPAGATPVPGFTPDRG